MGLRKGISPDATVRLSSVTRRGEVHHDLFGRNLRIVPSNEGEEVKLGEVVVVTVDAPSLPSIRAIVHKSALELVEGRLEPLAIPDPRTYYIAHTRHWRGVYSGLISRPLAIIGNVFTGGRQPKVRVKTIDGDSPHYEVDVCKAALIQVGIKTLGSEEPESAPTQQTEAHEPVSGQSMWHFPGSLAELSDKYLRMHYLKDWLSLFPPSKTWPHPFLLREIPISIKKSSVEDDGDNLVLAEERRWTFRTPYSHIYINSSRQDL